MKKLSILLIFSLMILQLHAVEFRTQLFTDMFIQVEPTEDFEIIRQRTYVKTDLAGDLFDFMVEYNISLGSYYDFFTDEHYTNPLNIIKEAYISIYPDWGDIHIGNRLVTLGQADVFSPLNRYNAVYSELFSLDDPYQSKLSQNSVEALFYLNDDSAFNLIYIPFTRANYHSAQVRETPELDKNLDEETTFLITDTPHSFFVGFNQYAFSYDLQILYGNFISPSQNYLNNEDSITQSYNREQVLGVSYSTSLGEVALINELALTLTENFDGELEGVKNSDITNNLQCTFTLFGRTYSQINMIYQYIFNYSDDSEFEIAVNDIQNQPVEHILFFIGHLHDSFLREKLYLALNMGFFFSTDFYIAPRMNYSISDRLVVESGFNIYTDEYIPKVLARENGADNFFLRLKFEI